MSIWIGRSELYDIGRLSIRAVETCASVPGDGPERLRWRTVPRLLSLHKQHVVW
jgi:hypothetical protein